MLWKSQARLPPCLLQLPSADVAGEWAAGAPLVPEGLSKLPCSWFLLLSIRLGTRAAFVTW